MIGERRAAAEDGPRPWDTPSPELMVVRGRPSQRARWHRRSAMASRADPQRLDHSASGLPRTAGATRLPFTNERAEPRLRMREQGLSKTTRLTVIVVVGVALLGFPAVLRVVGNREATNQAERIRTASTGARVDTSKLLAPMFNVRAPNPIAASVGVDSSDVSLQQTQTTGEWCADVRIRRLISEEHVFLSMSTDGSLRPVGSCSGRD